jgi:surface protein
MWNMFNNCCSLSSLDLSNFNTSNVKVMGEMFSGCSNLTSLDLSSFRTEKVEDMSGMFNNCSRLTSLNLYNFDMSGVYVYGKDRMCYNLASESGACTITCPTAVKTELQSGTDLNNSIITWHTH